MGNLTYMLTTGDTLTVVDPQTALIADAKGWPRAIRTGGAYWVRAENQDLLDLYHARESYPVYHAREEGEDLTQSSVESAVCQLLPFLGAPDGAWRFEWREDGRYWELLDTALEASSDRRLALYRELA